MTFLDQSQSFNNGTLLIIGAIMLVKLYLEKKYGIKVSDNIELVGVVAEKVVDKVIEKGPKLRGAVDIGKSVTGNTEDIPKAPNNSMLKKQVQVLDERLIQMERDYLLLVETKGFKELMPPNSQSDLPIDTPSEIEKAP